MENKLENLMYPLDLLRIKKYREILCRNYILENDMLSPQIIKFWKLERINNKYITKKRMYDENSYSKKKIREEELIFINKVVLFLNYRFYVEEQKKYADQFANFCDVQIDESKDKEIYMYVINQKNEKLYANIIAFYKNEKIRLDILSDIIQLKEVRKKMIQKHIYDNLQISQRIIKLYNLKRIKIKYIDKIRDYEENHYAKTKIKNEEIEFIAKFFLLGLWNNRVLEFNQLEKSFTKFAPELNPSKEGANNKQFFQKITTIYFEDFYRDNIDY